MAGWTGLIFDYLYRNYFLKWSTPCKNGHKRDGNSAFETPSSTSDFSDSGVMIVQSHKGFYQKVIIQDGGRCCGGVFSSLTMSKLQHF